MSLSARSRFQLPHWGWFLLGTVAFVIAEIGLSIWLRYRREQQVIQKIKSWGGRVVVETGGPDWLRSLAGEDRIKRTKVFTRINSVALQNARIADSEIAHLSGLRNVRCLYLSSTGLTNAGLAALSGCTNVEVLRIDGTGVTDDGLVHLSAMTKLNYLSLKSTAVSDAGLVHLDGLTDLRNLYLSDTAVTDAGLVHLSSFRNLRCLWIDRTAVTDEGVRELEIAWPGRDIVADE
jgi:hypothetical protein